MTEHERSYYRRIFELEKVDGNAISIYCYILRKSSNSRQSTKCQHKIIIKAPFELTERVTVKKVAYTTTIYRHMRTGISYIDDALDVLEVGIRGVMADMDMTLIQKSRDVEFLVRQCREQIAEHEKVE